MNELDYWQDAASRFERHNKGIQDVIMLKFLGAKGGITAVKKQLEMWGCKVELTDFINERIQKGER